MRNRRVTIAALALAAVLAPQVPSAQASPLRKVDPATGVGNCVFSPQELPKGGEGTAAYKAIRETFIEGEDIHIRCYWPKTLAAYRSDGKIYNEIRDKNIYSYGLVWMKPTANSSDSSEYYVQNMASDDAAGAFGWDQQRFDLVENAPDCDIKVKDGKLIDDYGVTSPFGCINLANFARTFPMAEGLQELRFCFRQYVEVADRMATYTGLDSSDSLRRRTISTTKLDTYPVNIAVGCFDYRLQG